MTIAELSPGNYGRKSFYGKAKIEFHDNGDMYLRSYNTIVAQITATGQFNRLWDGYSATTMRHVNAFVNQFYDANAGGKAWWDGLEVSK